MPPPSLAPAAPSRHPAAILQGLADAWQERVRSPRSRAEVAAIVVVLFGALFLARSGTPLARGVALGVALLPVALVAWGRLRDRALFGQPAKVIERLAGRVDADRAGRAIRALALISDGRPSGTSADLARLHVERTLRALPQDRILDRAVSLGARYARLTLLLGVGAVALAATRGFWLFEGADVLLARHHVAPLPVLWLDGLEVEARPPDYLHERERLLLPYGATALPRGSLLTFRGGMLHPGRRLLLTDGKSDVPFVDDGGGRVVARWPLGDTANLRVVARFGEVTIPEAEPTHVVSIADELPVVTLEGAPREIRIADVGVSATIPIKYEATDDHGLREVHLVLRSGAREERRVLARLDGETDVSRGGHTLRASDPFIKKGHAPVEVRVEAKDADPVTGPKWGVSAAFMIIPPEAGEPEALRLDALRELRDLYVDSLAGVIDRAFPASGPVPPDLVAADRKGVKDDELALEAAARGSYAGLSLSGRIVALLKGQVRALKAMMELEARSPGPASHGRLIAATERLVLVVDAATRGLAQHDARSVARTLAEVADDLVLGLAQMRRAEDRARGQARADGSVVVLSGGARSLERLGSLGRDLGEIVVMDLGRIARARDQDDVIHAEIAATDLAARLKDPDPSFGSQGGSGGRAGGEAGGARGTPSAGDPTDDAQQAFDEAAHELGRLSADHAEELGRVEQAMTEPDSPEETRAASEAGKSHAKAVREATRALPSIGAGSDSWTNKGAAAREHAEEMARAMEEGSSADAVTSGRSALDALEEAKQIARRERWNGMMSMADQDPDKALAERRIDAVRGRLEPEVKWAEEQLREARKRTARGRKLELSGHGDAEQRLAERAEALRARGEGSQALPEAALEALHQAARAAEEAASSLKSGEVEEGLARQREAQRRLEAASEALGGGESGDEGSDRGGAEDARPGHADIPTADAHKGPEEFRRRVIEGLGQAAGGRQKDAVRRYADGLLR